MAKGQGVILLQKYQLDVYSAMSESVVRFTFTPDSVRDYDIVNKDLFSNQLAYFIRQNSLQPVGVQIILGESVLFGKDIQIVDPMRKQNDIDSFLDTVPFASVGSATIQLAPNNVRVLATNKEMYEVVRDIFTANGFSVGMVLPGILLKDVALSEGLTPEAARAVLGRVDSVRHYNLMQVAAPTAQVLREQRAVVSGAGGLPEKRSNTRIFVLAGVFVFLILILVMVIMISGQQQ